eukprot:CAMPEP_0172545032 /NCGR_PEP_ID=MMETSP1067-20121228/15060_1 /TAXON_ID=265564 ORGANISM="Thalassiosira punctigera, Strain Tpunct2005C2" /NCGR_SAMPLE_ID=MMETSP1067 /ASSEMBLY_ACC=CAM_ASM_000444 /LENGTH=198 /DNA_ID=CAMNT_0013331703 /DNA_START=50 /DNA_END=643 /DNA_ORIENTATION=-
MIKLLFLLTTRAAIGSPSAFVSAFVSLGDRYVVASARQRTSLHMSTVVSPRETETERRKKRDDFQVPSDEGEIRGPLEWLIDDPLVSREDDEPFHILLLGETFKQNSRITIEYVASSCSYVLGMPYDESAELAATAENEGFSCLGTWSHGECVRLGRQLQNRDLVCRVVPFCEGGDRSWQARDAKDESGMKPAEDARW